MHAGAPVLLDDPPLALTASAQSVAAQSVAADTLAEAPAPIRALCEALVIEPPPAIEPAETYARGMPIPWPAKLAAKLVLARLPLRYATWRRLGLFRHGATPTAIEPRIAVFNHHVSVYRGQCGTLPRTIIEIGPGDSLATAILAHAAGATATLIDAGDFATHDMEHYRQVAIASGDAETRTLVETAADRGAMLARLGARYETGGVAALAAMHAASVDLIFSNAVLEHLPRDQMPDFFRASAYALHPNAVASHGVDLHDHLGGRLNHWRFSPAVWEHGLFRTSGFYTNRLPFSAYVETARACGFSVRIPWLRCWRQPPLSTAALHPSLRLRHDGDRWISGFGMIMLRMG